MAGAVSGAVPPPVASRTAPAKDRRSGATVCALSEGVANTVSAMSRLLFCNAMEIEVDVSVEIAGNIEAFGHARRERLARHDGMHERRHRELGRDGQVYGPKLAGLNTPFQHAGHQSVTARHYFFVIKPRELRKISCFRDHESRNTRERRFPYLPPVLSHQALEQVSSAAGEGFRDCLSLGEDGDDRLSDERLEKRFFVVEVEVDRACGDAGAARDVLELGRGEAAVGEDLEGGGDDFFGTGILATAPPRTNAESPGTSRFTCGSAGHFGSKVIN